MSGMSTYVRIYMRTHVHVCHSYILFMHVCVMHAMSVCCIDGYNIIYRQHIAANLWRGSGVSKTPFTL